jgi:3-deoxy-D-manno-octulosonic acid hydroxylase-like protein
MNVCEVLDITRWEGPFLPGHQEQAIHALEHGYLLYFPSLAFPLKSSEHTFLSPDWSDGNRKNISFEPATRRLGGITIQGDKAGAFKDMMARYAGVTRRLLEGLLPRYSQHFRQARTSFRPAKVEDRPQSYKDDDRLLHTDAFPSRPTQGARILRVFTNVNPSGRERVWRVGEPFEDMAGKFLPRTSRPLPGSASLLSALRITKGRRTPYDHLMLQLHDHVKADLGYQQRAPQVQLAFPPGSTWMVFTDQVLHAAMGGQYLFEQTFHLPVSAQRWAETSPLRTLERLTGRSLVP